MCKWSFSSVCCFITVVVAVLNGKWVSELQHAWSTLVAVQREVHVYLDGSNMSAVNSAVCVNHRSNTSVPASHWGGQRSGSLSEWLWGHRSKELEVTI